MFNLNADADEKQDKRHLYCLLDIKKEEINTNTIVLKIYS